MARKPEQFVIVLVATFAWWTAVEVCGQSAKAPAPAPVVIENPYYSAQPETSAASNETSPAPSTQRAEPRATAGQRYPVTPYSLENPYLKRHENEPWQSPRPTNPFSTEEGSRLLMRRLRWGPTNRWRQPDPPDVSSAPIVTSRQLRPVESADELRPLDDPVVLEPTAPHEETIAATTETPPHDRSGLQLPDAVAALPEGGEPPDPNQFSGIRVVQPTWLDAVDEEVNLAVPDGGKIDEGEQPEPLEIVVGEPNPKPDIHWVAPRNDTYDPFEETDRSVDMASQTTSNDVDEDASPAADPEQVVLHSLQIDGPILKSPARRDSHDSDAFEADDLPQAVDDGPKSDTEDSSTPISLDLEPPSEASTPQLAEARRLASEADTVATLSDVIRLARQVLTTDATADVLHSARELAAWAHNRRGELFEETGNGQAALDDFQAAVRLDGKCWLALHNRAIALAERHEYDQALRDFATVIELNPGLTVAYRNRGELLAALGRSQEASEDYTMALSQQPASPELYTLRGYAWLRMQDHSRALNDFTTSIQLNPDNPHALTGRGNLFAEVGQYDHAIANFNHALRADPTYVDALRSLAWLLATCPDEAHRNGQEALAAARLAARFAQPNDPFVLEALAAASAQIGSFDDALQFQRRAVAVAPTELAKTAQFRLDLYLQGQPYFSGRPQVVQAAFGE